MIFKFCLVKNIFQSVNVQCSTSISTTGRGFEIKDITERFDISVSVAGRILKKVLI